MRIHPASLALVLTLSLIFWGCEGPQGPEGVNPAMAPVITSLMAIPDSVGTNQSTQFVVAAYDPNGDALSYLWSAPVGSFSDAAVSNPVWTATDSMGLFAVQVQVSAGGETATGTLIVGVNTYVPSVTPYYLGDNANTCGHCHESVITDWMTTNHATACDSITGLPFYSESCDECHNTGWNEELDNGGYDDNPVAALQNVQCEACHGPMGPNPAAHEPEVFSVLSTADACAQCHEKQPEEFAESKHGNIMVNHGGVEAVIDEWGGAGCDDCHLGEGFLNKWDLDYAAPVSYASGQASPITCAVCHDAHREHTEHQLRAQVPVVLPNPVGYTISEWETSLMCANCHRDRRTAEQIQNHLNNGNAHFGPHPSPEANMVEGVGSYEIPGQTYTNPQNQHAGLAGFEDPCVRCHMRYVEGEGGPEATGHSFEPEQATCMMCHPVSSEFDYGNTKAEVEDLMAQLQQMILDHNPSLAAVGWSEENVGNAAYTTMEARTAAWAWFFVEQDGTFGIHNRDYAVEILTNSLNYYAGVTSGRSGSTAWK